jgi:MFS family permease
LNRFVKLTKLYRALLCCYAQTFSVMAATMVLGMPLGAFLTDRFSNNKQNIIVPAGLLSCGAFAGAAYASSWTMLYACLFAQGMPVLQIATILHAISHDGMHLSCYGTRTG